ncbi:MAG: ATP-binding protein [bacterium]
MNEHTSAELQPKVINVLLIEDDDAFVSLLSRMLTRHTNGLFQLNRVDTLQSGLEWLSKHNTDVVLLDLHLPDSSGLDTLKSLYERNPEMPILVLTNLDDEMMGIKALNLGAQDYLVKGNTNGDLLVRSIRYAIERQAMLIKLKRNASALEASERRFRHIVEQNIYPIIIVDQKKVIRFINKAGEMLFGCEAVECIGKTFNYDMNVVNETEIQIVKENDQTVIASMSVVNVEWEGEDVYLVILRDITKLKEIEQMKDNIISIISHEIRSPITSILNALLLIYEGENEKLSESSKKWLDIAYRNSERLLSLVNNMLDISKIESGKIEFNFKKQDLIILIKQAVDDNLPYANQFNVRLRIDTNLQKAIVYIDGDRIIQVLTNLISNAVKFSPSDDEVVISISEHDNVFRVMVIDHGPGIPIDFQDQIFQKFSQADQRNTKRKSGSGLGLYISKMLVENMGGKIGFDSQIGKGTTFYFELPQYR